MFCGSGFSGTNTSSSRLASPITAWSETPSAVSASTALESCPFPPSTSSRSGNAPPSSISRLNRRVTTWRIMAKSSGPATSVILNLRYSPFFGLPSTKQTRDATGSVPCVLEMSTASIRRGGRGSLRSL